MRMGIYNFIFVAIKNASKQHCAVLLEELDDLGHDSSAKFNWAPPPSLITSSHVAKISVAAMACTFVAPLQYITYIFSH